MTHTEIRIAYSEYESVEQMEQQERELVEAAIDAIRGSYAPYSKFNVGAAVRLDNGEIIQGANQENAAYPSGICAERTAMFYASAKYPENAITAIAIGASQQGVLCSNPVSPCGACRQVMAEYQTKGGQPMTIFLIGSEKIWKFEKVNDLLPLIFDSL